MDKDKIKVKLIGTPDISHLSEQEQKAFYITMLTQILEQRKQQLDKDNKKGD